MILLLFIQAALFANTMVTFIGEHENTAESVLPEKVIIRNLSNQKSFELTGTMTVDLDLVTGIDPRRSAASGPFALLGNYPNAFQEQTVFALSLPISQPVELSLFNILGQLITKRSFNLSAGEHTFTLFGKTLAEGLYFIQAITASGTDTRKILKTGISSGRQTEILYGGVKPIQNQNTSAKETAPGDVYRFIATASGFDPDTLDQITPVDGETLQFTFWPQVPNPVQIPEVWKGFNLLGLFTVEWAEGEYLEDDFEMISDFGFNFVRLPIDYRAYTQADDWLDFEKGGLEIIDDAVAWGQEYDIHVSINLHRAPGYCVNPPANPLPPEQDVSLWEDQDAQDVFAAHWAMFAERYRHISARDLSFNLVNEPANIEEAAYVQAVLPAIEAIRKVSPDRIVISDGLNWANEPIETLIPHSIAQSMHAYDPFQITHYKAEWASGSDGWPEPRWPMHPIGTYLYGSYKSEYQTPLIINGQFTAGTKVRLYVNQVSTSMRLDFKADGTTIWNKQFQPGPGEGEWEQVIYMEEWSVYQNIYNRVYDMVLPADAEQFGFYPGNGDWMTINEIRVLPAAGDSILLIPQISDWGVPQASYHLDTDGTLTVLDAPAEFAHYYESNGKIKRWQEIETQGVPVHVGEWGVYRFTPHDVTLRFMEDRLKALDAAGFGWALWNFRGSFGILDSGREDVDYEDYDGRQLDRKMLDLLQRY